MMYCPYTNTLPPVCTINRIIEISNSLKTYIKKALENDKKTYNVGFSDNIASSGDLVITVLNEDNDTVTVKIFVDAGSWSTGFTFEITLTIPKQMIFN